MLCDLPKQANAGRISSLRSAAKGEEELAAKLGDFLRKVQMKCKAQSQRNPTWLQLRECGGEARYHRYRYSKADLLSLL